MKTGVQSPMSKVQCPNRGARVVKAGSWIKRLGFWGFMFFLLKGLLWLTIPALIALFATE